MKLDSVIIPFDPPAIIAEVGQRRLGKYQVLGSWNLRSVGIANARTTMAGTPVDQPSAYRLPIAFDAADANWGERDDGSGIPRSKMPTSIKLAINPALAQEGDE